DVDGRRDRGQRVGERRLVEPLHDLDEGAPGRGERHDGVDDDQHASDPAHAGRAGARCRLSGIDARRS
ncbi:hypothetical protein ABE10_00825, partial [Bacillus toyonensis]|nr:hypothetical protein [Bacillus toyonensis]